MFDQQVFSLGTKARKEKGPSAALPYYQRAIELDPNYAAAYDMMGFVYDNLGESERAHAYITKAFQLTRIIHIFEDNKSLLCYKHVDETMFAATKEASECLKIAQHSVCCSQEFFASLWLPSSISARGVPTAEPCC
jgi:tetratricopeptide (TPR) repeat protein